MSYGSYLSQSPAGGFYFRLRLLPSLAIKLGVKEVRRSLRTNDVLEARRKALELFQIAQEAQADSATQQSLDAFLERFTGAVGPLQKEGSTPRKIASVEEGLGKYCAERAHLWTAKTAQEVESIIRRFNIAQSTTRADAVVHKGRLAHLHPKTQNKHLQRLRDLFEFLRTNGYVQTENPFQGLPLRLKPARLASEARSIWSDSDCRRLALIDHWLPRLGLYTGGRINELAQLSLSDIDDQCLHIRAEKADQRLKNLSSKRQVPIHSELVRLGFLDYVHQRRRESYERLFDFPLGRDGYGQAASRWFSRLRRKHSLPDFHSIRHTVATKLREADVAEDVVAELLGHAKGSTMAFRRYAKASSLKRLQTGLEQLSYGVLET